MKREGEKPGSDVVPSTRGAVDRRQFVRGVVQACGYAAPVLLGVVRISALDAQDTAEDGYNAQDHLYGMGIDVNKCIGCGRCVQACKTENDVPLDDHHSTPGSSAT